jgi:hypothetical protein
MVAATVVLPSKNSLLLDRILVFIHSKGEKEKKAATVKQTISKGSIYSLIEFVRLTKSSMPEKENIAFKKHQH